MKKTAFRQSINTGIVFGIVHIFFVLIAFNSILGGLLAELVGVKTRGQTPLVGSLIAYAAILGIWAGILSARRQREENSARISLLASLVTGVTFGLLAALLVGIFQG